MRCFLAATLMLGLTGAAATAANADTTARASVGPGGMQANDLSEVRDISADGRFVAFSSFASNLVAGDRNGSEDVFLRDLMRDETDLVSVANGRNQGNDASFQPAISADGRFVCFTSYATNLVPGDTNGQADIFLRDRDRRTTIRVNVATSGEQANDLTFDCAISADGRYIAFDSIASNLVPGDTNRDYDIFVHDRVEARTRRVNLGPHGIEAEGGYSISPAISANGRWIAFQSSARNLVPDPIGRGANIYVHDVATGTTLLASRGVDGRAIDVGTSFPAISADGRYVAFDANSTNLVRGDSNGADDVFVFNTKTLRTTRVSVGSHGRQANGPSGMPRLSSDGRFVAFQSFASNLVTNDTNGMTDIFVHDRLTGITKRVSVGVAGTQANDESAYHFTISPGGKLIAFTSLASNLVPGDTNWQEDVFLRRVAIPPRP